MALGTLVTATGSAEEAQGARAPRRLVLCLDGTWKSTYDEAKRRDGHTVLKPSNVLKTCRAVLPVDDSGTVQIAYYDIGVGALAEYPGAANRLLYFSDRALGGAWGAGFEGNVESALDFLAVNYESGDEIFIFGFSRGAATARGVTRFLEWNGGLPEKIDAYYLPRLFRAFVISRGAPGEQQRVVDEINADRANEHPPRPPLNPFRATPVRYLGVWDTVMALGSRFQATGASTSGPGTSFYAGTSPAACVLHARQALAVDEHRYDFRPEVWTHALAGQEMEQRWFAGVHSNVGGGYLHDGLANVAFRWILDGALAQGLKIDPEYVKHFRPWPGDSLYDSDSIVYRILDFVRFRAGRGRRNLTAYPASSNLEIDASVIRRMQAKSGTINGSDDLPTDAPYRPANVIEFLSSLPDPDGYLEKIGIVDPLPEDVRQRITELRQRAGTAALHKSTADDR